MDSRNVVYQRTGCCHCRSLRLPANSVLFHRYHANQLRVADHLIVGESADASILSLEHAALPHGNGRCSGAGHALYSRDAAPNRIATDGLRLSDTEGLGRTRLCCAYTAISKTSAIRKYS